MAHSFVADVLLQLFESFRLVWSGPELQLEHSIDPFLQACTKACTHAQRKQHDCKRDMSEPFNALEQYLACWQEAASQAAASLGLGEDFSGTLRVRLVHVRLGKQLQEKA